MNRRDQPDPPRYVPPWASKRGDRPNPLWPPAPRALWLDGWEQGYLDGYARAQYERRELDRASCAA